MYERISYSHLKSHNLTFIDYKNLFPNVKVFSDDIINKISKTLTGRKLSPETIEKLKKSARYGDNNPSRRPEVREKLSGKNNHFYGKHHTEETKRKISNKRRGKLTGNLNPSKRPEVREKISRNRRGIYHTEETKRKNSDWHKGKITWNNGLTSITDNRIAYGDRNGNWNGGTSFLPYCSKFNVKLKDEIIKRDNYQCQNPNCLCTQIESLILYHRKLHIHHIHYDKENCYPDLITLCNKCNIKANFNRNYYEDLYMKILEERNLLNWKLK